MPNGANSVHKQLRTELEDYIKSQYFGKSPLLTAFKAFPLVSHGLESYTTATTLQKAGRRSLPSRPARIVGINFLHHSLPHLALEVISLSST